MITILKHIDKGARLISIGLIRIYQVTLSPDKGIPSLWLKGRICSHEPHCSQYSINVLKRYNFFSSRRKIMERVSSCTGGTCKTYDPDHYKVVFMSSAPIGVPFLEKLNQDPRFEVVGVVTMPDKPSGRGMHMHANIIKEKAQELDENHPPTPSLQKKGSYSNFDFHANESYIKEKKLISSGKYLPYYPELKERAKELRNNPTSAELKFWLEYCKKRNINILRQKPIDHYIVDFYIPSCKLVIEIDGSAHRNNEAIEYDTIRDEILELYGLQIIRITNDQIFNNFEDVSKKIDKLIENPPSLLKRGLGGDFIKTPESLKLDSKKYADDAQDIYSWLQKLQPDFIVVIAYGKIIPQHILDLPKIGPINVHGSILPEYRGASPIQSVFLDKRKETGITIMKMFAELDTGDMIDTLKFPLPLNRTALDCIQHMQKVGPDFLANTLESYAKARLVDKPQNNDKATYCSKIEKEQGEVDPFTDSLDDIFAKHKGYFLRPKAHFIAPAGRKNAGKIVIIDTIICDEKTFEEHKNSPLLIFTPQNCGEEGARGGLNINPAIKTLMLKPEGKKAMSREEFTNGYIQ